MADVAARGTPPPSAVPPTSVGPVRSVLERFRRAAAVPAAVADDLEAELLPVFAALAEIEAEAARVREDARAEADRRLADAETEAERVRAAAAERAEAERAEAAAARREAARTSALALESEARAEADAIRARGRERLPALVADVIRRATGGE